MLIPHVQTNGPVTVPGYLSAYTSSGVKAVSTNGRIPISLRYGRWENLYLENNEIKLIKTPVVGGEPDEMEAIGEGLYAVFFYIRCTATSNGTIALMSNAGMASNTYMPIDNSHLTQSQLSIRELRMDDALYLSVRSGSIVLADGENINIVLVKIRDLPPQP